MAHSQVPNLHCLCSMPLERRASVSLHSHGPLVCALAASRVVLGLNKKDCTKKYGKEQLKQWRRSWDVPPPAYEEGCELYRQETDAFLAKVDTLTGRGEVACIGGAVASVYCEHRKDCFRFGKMCCYRNSRSARAATPKKTRADSLQHTHTLLQLVFASIPAQAGRRLMVFGHENNLRALVKLLDDIDEDAILEVDIPRAMPMVYFFEREQVVTGQTTTAPRLAPIRVTPPDAEDGAQLLSA
eukprot:3773897-Amphidinium_carterae.2